MNEYRLKPSVSKTDAAPQEKPEPITPSTRMPETEEAKPGELHSISYFDIKGWGQMLLEPKLDVNQTKEKVVFIEQFLKDQIASDGLKSDKATIYKLLERIEKNLSSGDMFDGPVRVNKIFKLFKHMKATQAKKRRVQDIFDSAKRAAKKSTF